MNASYDNTIHLSQVLQLWLDHIHILVSWYMLLCTITKAIEEPPVTDVNPTLWHKDLSTSIKIGYSISAESPVKDSTLDSTKDSSIYTYLLQSDSTITVKETYA